MLYKSLPFLYHLHTGTLQFEGCQQVQKALPFSTTANTVTTATQTHLELHPKFLWARQRPLLPSKSVRSLFFFGLRPDPPPPTLGSGSSFHHPLDDLHQVDMACTVCTVYLVDIMQSRSSEILAAIKFVLSSFH